MTIDTPKSKQRAPKSKRTDQQNKAMHLYFSLLADELNQAGFDVTKVIQTDLPWTPESVKELIWRTTQNHLYNKKSTTELNKSEIDLIYETINRAIGERCGIYLPFPSIENV